MNRLQDSSLSVHTASCTSSGEEMPRRHDHGIRPLRYRAGKYYRRNQSRTERIIEKTVSGREHPRLFVRNALFRVLQRTLSHETPYCERIEDPLYHECA